MANSFVERCKQVYSELRDAQLQRAEAYAIGYDTELAMFYAEVEPRVLYHDVMISVASEVRAERDAEHAEYEMWVAREQAHYAPYVAEALMVVPDEDTSRLFKNRSAAMVYALVCARTAARSIARPATLSTPITTLPNGDSVMSTAPSQRGSRLSEPVLLDHP